MKNQITNPFKWIFLLLVTTVIVLNVACQSNKTKAQNDQIALTAPKVDIHSAVLTNNIEAIKQHIEVGTDLNSKDPLGGSTPLISASLFGKKEIVDILLEANADINAQNNEGSTALITAAFFCRPEIVKTLLENGADKTIKNNYGSTAFDSVEGPFESVKPAYDMMKELLRPMGLKLDYPYIEKTRPQIANMLQ